MLTAALPVEWLARKLDRSGIGYERLDNALARLDDLPRADTIGIAEDLGIFFGSLRGLC